VSYLTPTVAPMPLPHPWRRLRDLAHVTLVWHDHGPMGKCKHSTQEVSLRRDLTQAQRRAALLHELEHLEHGPAVVGYVEEDEMATRERAARWLIPIENLAAAMIWANDDHELAEELWVDLGTVRTRLSTLTAVETRHLNDRVDAAERTFPSESG
jgi:hypothetical protein